AGFVGGANFLPAHTEGGTLVCDLGIVPVKKLPEGESEVMLRPEDITLAEEGTTAVELVGREYHGPFVLYRIRFASGNEAWVRRAAAAILDRATPVRASMRVASPVVFEKSSEA